MWSASHDRRPAVPASETEVASNDTGVVIISERHFDIEIVPLRLQRCYFLVFCKYIVLFN